MIGSGIDSCCWTGSRKARDSDRHAKGGVCASQGELGARKSSDLKRKIRSADHRSPIRAPAPRTRRPVRGNAVWLQNPHFPCREFRVQSPERVAVRAPELESERLPINRSTSIDRKRRCGARAASRSWVNNRNACRSCRRDVGGRNRCGQRRTANVLRS